MTNRTGDPVLEAIFTRIADTAGRFDFPAYEDAFSCIRNLSKDLPQPDVDSTHRLMELITNATTAALSMENWKFADAVSGLFRRTLFYTAPYCLDDFARAIEIDKAAQKRFYAPRRHYLKPMVQGYQDILDGKIRLLTVSMPKRAGKSQTEILFTLLLSGRYPDRSSLMEGTGDDLVKSFYQGCLEYLLIPNEYNYYDIFPNARLVQTNADLKTINLNSRSRFPTVMCRSIDSRQVGLSEATNALILDDCVEGREEAKNRQRLDDKWEVISGDVMGRAIEGTPMVFTGTRYSIYDPIGRIQEHAQKEGWAWRAVEIPALDPVTDESNYEHIREGKRVFTTAFFREQRELLSPEQFESEFQQQPFEAKGVLFPKDDLNYYFDLPQKEGKPEVPDAIFAVCDTAESGADSVSMPVGYIYGEKVYIEDVVFDNSPPEITKDECASCLIRNNVGGATFESNNAGVYYARDVADKCKERGYRISIRTKRTTANKQTKIEIASDNIKKFFYFKHPSKVKRGSQYDLFMKEVTTYTRTGKVPHDDAPDSLAMMENELRMRLAPAVEVFKRPF